METINKGRAGQIGEIRTWAGKKYQKTAKGWRPVAGNADKAGAKEPEPEKKAPEKNDNGASEFLKKTIGDKEWNVMKILSGCNWDKYPKQTAYQVATCVHMMGVGPNQTGTIAGVFRSALEAYKDIGSDAQIDCGKAIKILEGCQSHYKEINMFDTAIHRLSQQGWELSYSGDATKVLGSGCTAKIDLYSENEGVYGCEMKGVNNILSKVSLSGSIDDIVQAAYYLDKANIKIKK